MLGWLVLVDFTRELMPANVELNSKQYFLLELFCLSRQKFRRRYNFSSLLSSGAFNADVSELKFFSEFFCFLLSSFHSFYGLLKPRNSLTFGVRCSGFSSSLASFDPIFFYSGLKSALFHFPLCLFLILNLLKLDVPFVFIDYIESIDKFLLSFDS